MPTFAREIAFRRGDGRVADARPAHRAHIADLYAAGAVRMSGPWADGHGALIVYEAPDRAAVEELIASDPYSMRGVVEEVALREWVTVVPPRPGTEEG